MRHITNGWRVSQTAARTDKTRAIFGLRQICVAKIGLNSAIERVNPLEADGVRASSPFQQIDSLD